MIARLQGTLIEKNPPAIVIDIAGVGYLVEVSMHTFYALPDIGSPVTLLIHSHYRENEISLFGFNCQEERALFRLLLKVNGIGVKVALTILSALNSEELGRAINESDVDRLMQVPRLGKKSAERLILELKGKLAKDSGQTQENQQKKADLMEALLSLGFQKKEIEKAIREWDEKLDLSEGLKYALRQLVK